MYFSVRIF